MWGYIRSVNRKQSKIWSTISIGKNIIFKNIELIKETKSKYVIMEFGGNYCGYNWREISENPDKEHYSKSSITEFIEIYSYLIDEFKKIGKEPVLLSLPPIDITSKFLEIKNYSNLLCDDGIHPNEKGHKIIAEAIKEHIEKRKIKLIG